MILTDEDLVSTADDLRNETPINVQYVGVRTQSRTQILSCL